MKRNHALVLGSLYAAAMSTSSTAKIIIIWLATRRKLIANEAAIRNANAAYTWGM